MTATSYNSITEELIDYASKVKTLEIFGPDLDFAIIQSCTRSETNHTIGHKHVKLLAEEGLVQVKFDKEAEA